MIKDVPQPRETEVNPVATHRFSVIKPGGNDTALFIGIPDATRRRPLNNAIMGIYPNVEQVGFVNLHPQNAELMMAGGEFCGNATRATAWQVLKGEPGDIEIKVSGVEGKLKAGVTRDGEAYAQMPVYSDASHIQQDPRIPSNYTVSMEGIIHYIDFNTNQIEGLSADELKEKAFADMQARDLDKGPAAGIIYTERQEDGYRITPVVYVRDIDTLFVETACGSGTAALGLAIAKQEGESVDRVSILQPSGLPIKVSVDYDGNNVGYTQIQGPVEVLHEGMFETSKGIPYVVEQITSEQGLEAALTKRGLRDAYRDAFGRPPYNERFEDEEIDSMFRDYARDGDVFVAVDKGEIIAFAATQPLQSVPHIGELLSEAPGIDGSSWYIPDVGIRKEYEGNGIAKTLTQSAIDSVPVDACITLRTSVDNIRSQGLYRRLGFDVVPEVYQEISQARVDGETVEDLRLFMALHRNGSPDHANSGASGESKSGVLFQK